MTFVAATRCNARAALSTLCIAGHLICSLGCGSSKHQSGLDRVIKKGVLRIGTTGDYHPFTYLNQANGLYEGFDIEAGKRLAAAMGVKVEWVAAAWETIAYGVREDRYDVAMGGISRTLKRGRIATFSRPYMRVGKAPIIRKSDAHRFHTLADYNQPHIRVGINLGGTNEVFVRSQLSNATIVAFQKNLELPKRISDGTVDVMITDNVEGYAVERMYPDLMLVNPDQPFNTEDLAYIVPRGDHVFKRFVDHWIVDMRFHGEFDALVSQYIKPVSEPALPAPRQKIPPLVRDE